MRKLVLTVALAGGLLLLPSVASSAGSISTAKKLSSMLLTINQMPTGWSVESSGSGGVGCLANILEPNGVKQTASATATFADNGNLPEVEEKLATYSGSTNTAFSKATAALNSCKKVNGTSGGSKVTGTVGQMSFPPYGNQSAAFDINLSTQGENLGEDAVIVRSGSIIMAISDGTIGTPNINQFEEFVKKAVAKL